MGTAPSGVARCRAHRGTGRGVGSRYLSVSEPPVLSPRATAARQTAVTGTGWAGTDASGRRVRTVAFYLPQYHTIPENDEWWGPGFTDWVNVKSTRPRFRGHAQPDLPGELGCYDLTDRGVMQAQADLAAAHGVDAFCYYHYWFSGRRLLEAPFARVLASPRTTLPFCLCWANENWSRRWDGGGGEVLVEQTYSEEDDREHGRWLAAVFADPRYLRVDGRPLFLVYRALHHPDIASATAIWREEARRAGVGDVFLCRMESFAEERGDPTKLGFDAAVDFASPMHHQGTTVQSLVARSLRRLGASPRTIRFDYGRAVARATRRRPPEYLCFPGVMPGWDNSPRRARNATVFQGATPQRYQEWVTHAADSALQVKAGDTFVFVNAWNEWAEGAHLEPGQRYGRAFLQAHRDAMARIR